MIKTARSIMQLALATAVVVCIAAPVSAFQGQVGAYGNGPLFLWTNHPKKGEFITLPDGMFGIKNRGRNFDYRLRFDGRKTDKSQVQAFVVDFCRLLQKPAKLAFSKENRVRNQVADFSCK